MTTYIAEFWNSLSSLFIVVDGPYGMYYHYYGVEMRIAVVFFMLTVVEFGSLQFYATLEGKWQLLDELPMIWENSVFIYVVYFMESQKSTHKMSFV